MSLLFCQALNYLPYIVHALDHKEEKYFCFLIPKKICLF